MSFQSVSGFHPLDLISPAFDAMGTYVQSFNGVPVQYAVGSDQWKNQTGLPSKYDGRAEAFLSRLPPEMQAIFRKNMKPPVNRNPTPPPATPAGPPSSAFSWQFPQYSQTWAFTPPKPTPYDQPPAFDKSKYGGTGLGAFKPSKQAAPAPNMSIQELMAKYRRPTPPAPPLGRGLPFPNPLAFR